jgi:hypothetical protein
MARPHGGRDLVIIDSLRAASGGQDENSSEIRACLLRVLDVELLSSVQLTARAQLGDYCGESAT